MSTENVVNAAGNAGLTLGSSAGVLGVLSANYDIIMMAIAFTGLLVGAVFKYLHYRLERKRHDKEDSQRDGA